MKLLALPDIKTNDRTTEISSVWYWINLKRLVEQSRMPRNSPTHTSMATWFITNVKTQDSEGKANLLINDAMSIAKGLSAAGFEDGGLPW